ncbi:MAG: gamma-glutamyltransferase [Rhodospirillales bacterium]|nr:gamma-glutamyltransferase [Rhodospirillales bacterium]
MRRAAVLAALSVALSLPAAIPAALAQEQPAIISERDIIHPVTAEHGIVATQEETATRIGIDILKAGGNAVDAGVAVGFALAVTLPRAGNLGGGGFMLIHSAETDETIALDYREMAPAAAHKDMYLDAAGEVDSQKSRYSYHAAGVPGTVAGLTKALEEHGTMSLAEVMAPAIALAENGITVSRDLAHSLTEARKRFAPWPESMKIFFKPDGSAYEAGDTLVQTDLAESLKLIAANGASAFYEGEIARKIADDMAANGGPITLEDLKAYKTVTREPVTGDYRGYRIASMPPPSSGGIHIIQILNILEGFPIGYLGHNGAETIHLMAEAMKLAYADRSEYLGDPDYANVPVSGLISEEYAATLRNKINRNRAAPSENIKPGDPLPYESDQTTHYSIMDAAGNVVANTYTINFSYGSGIVAAGTGILLNNEMDDFSAKPGVPNAYGLIGGEANAIEPGKRPLSSMSPTIVFKDGEPFVATGSPGGSRIITTVLQVLMNVIDHDMNIAAAQAAPRVHHQWLPDELRVEDGLGPDTVALLAAKGHTIAVKDAMGSAQSVMRLGDRVAGASDPRRPGALTLGY